MKVDTQQNQPAPVNLAAERSVLGAVIEDDTLLPELIACGLTENDFGLNEHRRLFAAIGALRQQNRPVDYITVAEQLGNRQEDYALVARLIDGSVTDPDHVLYHARIVQKKARLRALLRLADWIARVADDSADPDALIEQIIGKLERMAPAEVVA